MDRISADDDDEPEPLVAEVEKVIDQLTNGKSPGCDIITAKEIKASGEAGVKIYHRLICSIWKAGEWPVEWKRAVFVILPKKGDLQQCSNHRTISLISHASKILLKILLNRIRNKIESEISQTQAGFRPGGGIRDHIFNLRMLIGKFQEMSKDLHICFIDYSKAFDCVRHNQLWETLLEMGFSKKITSLIQARNIHT